MLFKLVALAVVLRVVLSAPSDVVVAYPSFEVVVKPNTIITLIGDIFNAVIGHKVSALNLAAAVIEWMASNIFVIFFGITTALGFCKITGKCSLDCVNYPSIVTLGNMVTPEHLDTAQKFLITAVEKYSEKRKRDI